MKVFGPLIGIACGIALAWLAWQVIDAVTS
jgi:hypothetical protein